MSAGLLLRAQFDIQIGEERSIDHVALFVNESGAKSPHPLLANQRSAVSDQPLVKRKTLGGIPDVDPVQVDAVLQSGHGFSVPLRTNPGRRASGRIERGRRR